MNGRDIFRGLQYIGDDLIENAETGQFPAQNQGSGKTRRPIRRSAANCGADRPSAASGGVRGGVCAENGACKNRHAAPTSGITHW